MSRLDLKRIKERCTEDGDCLVWQGSVDKSGVPRMTVKTNRIGKTVQIRREMWEHKTGEKVPAGMRVTCTCGNKRCLEHLEAITCGEVIRRTAQSPIVRSKRHLAGLKTRQRAKLDMEKAEYIRTCGKPLSEVAKELGIGMTTASRVRRGVSWKDYRNPFAGLGG